jgi:hypothetical protein
MTKFISAGGIIMTQLKPINDVYFKLLFGDVRNIGILQDFLKAILNLPDNELDHIVLADPHLKRQFINDKLGILDVKVFTTTDKVIDIEVQVKRDAAMRERETIYRPSGNSYHRTIMLAEAKPEVRKVVGEYLELTEDEEARMLAESRERWLAGQLSREHDAREEGRKEAEAEAAARISQMAAQYDREQARNAQLQAENEKLRAELEEIKLGRK